MPSSLVIVESPAKCKKIESYLGPGYKVIASFGHLRTIKNLTDIDIENGFQTKYSIIDESLKLKQIEKIRSEISNSSETILATDDDREGEAIAWHICQLFGLSITNTKRIIFHEITEQAIQIAISHPKRINMDLVNAQQSRQILDLLVGFTITPILWTNISKTYDKSLSAGRCQTPALRLVYENYLDIKTSPGKLIYNTTGYFTNLNLLFELNKQFDNKNTVIEFLTECKDFSFICNCASPKKVIKKAPEPLTTSSLQQLASNEQHLSPKDTMKYAQQLYEAGYITYMRTDSKKFSMDFIESLKIYISTNHGKEYISQNIDGLSCSLEEGEIEEKSKSKKKTMQEKKGIPPPQEAHEAIRPVNINIYSKLLEEKNELVSKAIKLYDLIWKRTLESCMPSAQYNSISAKINSPKESEFVYKSEQVIFPGWQIVSNKFELTSKTYQYLCTLKQGVNMIPKKIESKFTLNELKSHYTEARLVQLLEEKGIGRPSTFASLIDKIQERKYVEKQNIEGKEIECSDFILTNDKIEETSNKRTFGNEKGKLVIQPLGILVIEFLLQQCESFFSYTYTKEMEDNLDLIAKGKKIWNSLCSDCYKELTTVTDKLKDMKKFSMKIEDNKELIIGKHGPVIKCVNPSNTKDVSFLPVKKNIDLDNLIDKNELTLENIIDNKTKKPDAIGKYKGQDLFIKQGKYGIYAQWGKETKSLNCEFKDYPIDKIEYIEVIRYLDRDTVLDPSKPVNIVRELNKHLSIRTGKYGDYIFYKKSGAKKPDFFKLKDFNSDYKICDKSLLLNWIKQTYNVE